MKPVEAKNLAYLKPLPIFAEGCGLVVPIPV